MALGVRRRGPRVAQATGDEGKRPRPGEIRPCHSEAWRVPVVYRPTGGRGPDDPQRIPPLLHPVHPAGIRPPPDASPAGCGPRDTALAHPLHQRGAVRLDAGHPVRTARAVAPPSLPWGRGGGVGGGPDAGTAGAPPGAPRASQAASGTQQTRTWIEEPTSCTERHQPDGGVWL